MATTVQNIIQWVQENAFSIEGHDGTKYVAIDTEAMGLHFNKWLKEERKQHGRTWDAAIQAHDDRGHVIARSHTDFDEHTIH